MSGQIIDEQYLYDIANAIRRKNGKTTLYRPQDMGDAILDISSADEIFKQFIDTKTIDSLRIDGLTNIRNSAFKEYTSLVSVNFPDVITIGTYSFNNCTSLTTVNLPSCTIVEEYAFKDCTSLTTIDLSSATTIKTYAFDYCISLTDITLSACTTIENNAFTSCNSLTTIELPSVTEIKNNAFYSCRNLTSVILPGSTKCELSGEYVFYYTPIQSGTGYIYVPSNLVNSYKNSTYWYAYANQIVAIPDNNE